MPELEWNELDFLQCLATLPVVEEYGVSHTYTVTDKVLTLELIVYQIESVIEFALSRTGMEQPIMRFALVVRDKIRYREGKQGESLEFRDCVFVPRRFYMTDVGDVFVRERFPMGLMVELTVHPSIQFAFQ